MHGHDRRALFRRRQILFRVYRFVPNMRDNFVINSPERPSLSARSSAKWTTSSPEHRDHVFLHMASVIAFFLREVGLHEVRKDGQEIVFRIEDAELGVAFFEKCG